MSTFNYPILMGKELQLHEKDFISYLALSGIEAKDWEDIKKSNPAKMGEILQDFSNGIWASKLEKIKFLNVFTDKNLLSFAFFSDRAILIGLEGNIDFSTLLSADLSELQELIEKERSKLRIFKKDKSYTKDYNQEVFEILKLGGRIADERVFELLKSLK